MVVTKQEDLIQRALLELEQRYRRIFDSAQDGILIIDALTGLILEVYPYLSDLLGYPSAEIVRLKLWGIGAYVDKAKSLQAFADLQDKLYVYCDDMPLLTKAAKSIAVEFVSNVYSVGAAMVIHCNIRDVSERKRAGWPVAGLRQCGDGRLKWHR